MLSGFYLEVLFPPTLSKPATPLFHTGNEGSSCFPWKFLKIRCSEIESEGIFHNIWLVIYIWYQ